MQPISLECLPEGTYILSCGCGVIEIGCGEAWQDFLVSPQANDMAVITCGRCQAAVQCRNPIPNMHAAPPAGRGR